MKSEAAIDLKYLTSPTGDPFVDVGGHVIEFLQKEVPQGTPFEHIEKLTNIYTKNWSGKLNTLFHGSKMTHPSLNGKIPEQKKKTLDDFKLIIEEKVDGMRQGYCRVTGKKGAIFPAGRDYSILTGSKAFVNFHHSLDTGIFLSKEVLIRIFALPYGCEYLGGKISVVATNKPELTRYLINENCERNNKDIASRSSKGVLHSEFSNPANAIFKKADSLIKAKRREIEDQAEDVSIDLYHFTNFAASPEMNLFKMPSAVFNFYSACIKEYPKEWGHLIFRNYANKKNNEYNDHKMQIIQLKGKNTETFTHDAYKTWHNNIYHNLLHHKSIVRQILKYNRYYNFPFGIVREYLKGVRNMDVKTVERIKSIADFITSMEDDGVKKYIKDLNSYSKAFELRQLLVKLVKNNYVENNGLPLITLKDYAQYLFADSSHWGEIRDVLLIAIYQNLHESKRKILLAKEEIRDEESDDSEE